MRLLVWPLHGLWSSRHCIGSSQESLGRRILLSHWRIIPSLSLIIWTNQCDLCDLFELFKTIALDALMTSNNRKNLLWSHQVSLNLIKERQGGDNGESRVSHWEDRGRQQRDLITFLVGLWSHSCAPQWKGGFNYENVCVVEVSKDIEIQNLSCKVQAYKNLLCECRI